MDRHDKAFLDKQLWGKSSHPPSPIVLAFAAVIFGGIVIIIGSALFGGEYRQARTILPDVTGAIALQKSPVNDPVSKTERAGRVN